MKIYNTLSRKIEEFVPLNQPHVGMYTCGPTVYDYQHIGNFRTMVLSDLLTRVLRYNRYDVKSVRNITDIDDKIIRSASAKGVPIKEYSSEFTKIFFEDLEKLNVLPVSVVTYATEYVPKMIEYIKKLIEKGVAYVEPDGSVYFDVSKFPKYGKLNRIDKKELKSGTRMLSDEYSKESAQDFALWKSVGKEEREGYDSPWSRGRPGWHIECSVMSQENLGDTFDIHTGGRDLMFPHHENEIAQSEAKTGKKFVNYWVHGEFLNVDGGKMSKSLRNFYTIKNVEERGFDPIALRYFYLSAHYRTVLNFTWEGLKSAQNALAKIRRRVVDMRNNSGMQALTSRHEENVDLMGQFETEFMEAINADLNMPVAVAVVWKMLDDKNLADREKYRLLLKFDGVLGLDLNNVAKEEVLEFPEIVSILFAKREKLRNEKKFSESDLVREEIEKLGYTVKDSTEGSSVVKI